MLLRCIVVGPQNGWNDPPALNRAATKKKVSLLIGAASKGQGNGPIQNTASVLLLLHHQGLENYTPPAPITAPIMGPPGSDPQPMSPISLQGSMDPGQGAFQGPFSGRQQLPPSSGGRPTMPQTSVEGPPGAPTGDHIQVYSPSCPATRRICKLLFALAYFVFIS